MVIAVGAELYFIIKMQLDDPKRKERIKKAKKEDFGRRRRYDDERLHMKSAAMLRQQV